MKVSFDDAKVKNFNITRTNRSFSAKVRYMTSLTLSTFDLHQN